jgi:hypothetical protein
MAAESFNVAVLATLRNRVSQGLRLIARDFSGTDRSVRALQRSLDNLQVRHGIYAQRVRTTQAAERESTAGLQQRLQLMQATSAAEASAGRIQAEQLSGLQRRVALQKVASREQADQVRISELQASINRRNAMAQLRDTEAQNKLLLQQQAIQERTLALQEEQAAAARARVGAALRIGGGAALIAGAAAFETAKAGLPVGMYLQQIRQGAPLTAQQAAALPSMALQLSAQSTQFTYKEVLQTLRQLIPLYGYGPTQAVAPSIFALGALERERGIDTPLADMSLSTMQTLRTLRARTPQQQTAVIDALTSMLFRANVEPEDFNETLRTMGVATATLPFAQRLQAGMLTQMVMSLGGGQAGLTSSGMANIFKTLLMPRMGSQIALMHLLNPRNLPLGGAAGVTNAMQLISGAPRGFTLPERIMMGHELPEFLALQNQLQGPVGAQVRAVLAQRMNPQQLLATSLTTAAPAMRNLAVSLENFVTAIGVREDKPLAGIANWFAAGYAGAAADIQREGAGWLKDVPGWLLNLAAGSYTPGPGGAPHSGSWADRVGLWGSPQVTINVNGAGNPDAVAKTVVKHLKQSAMSNTKARGPVASPKVYPGS